MIDSERPFSVKVLLVLLAVQAVSAIGGGVGLIRDPIDNIGQPLDLLQGSLFHDYLLAGLILLMVVGLAIPVAGLGKLTRGYYQVTLR